MRLLSNTLQCIVRYGWSFFEICDEDIVFSSFNYFFTPSILKETEGNILFEWEVQSRNLALCLLLPI